jgi:hypothetical protein
MQIISTLVLSTALCFSPVVQALESPHSISHTIVAKLTQSKALEKRHQVINCVIEIGLEKLRQANKISESFTEDMLLFDKEALRRHLLRSYVAATCTVYF